MNIARAFSYTRLLEDQLARERDEHAKAITELKADHQRHINELRDSHTDARRHWEEKERSLIDGALRGAGKPPVYQQPQAPTPVTSKPMQLPRIAAKNRVHEKVKELEALEAMAVEEFRKQAQNYKAS